MGKLLKEKIDRFDNGILEDIRIRDSAGFSLSRHFDILTFPHRLQALRGMTTESTTDSKISNIIVAGSSDRMYGVGTDPNNPTLGKLWVRSDNNTTASGSSYGASSTWRSLTTNQLSGAVLRTGASGSDDAFLVDYPDATGLRRIYWASTNLICSSDPEGGSSANTQALTFSTISQGFVHPKDKILYFAYQDASTPKRNFIGTINASGTLTGAVIELPKASRVYALTAYGNYLAIGCTFPASSQGTYSSVVYLWDRDTSLTTFNESIPWGAGALKVLNNVNGALVGVNTFSVAANGAIQDYDSLQIKVWSGGNEPTVVAEVPAINIPGAGTPSVTIYPNVNFVYQNRLYFSADISVNSTLIYTGLWSVGRNRLGRWATTIERSATNAGTETGVIAAAISGDFCAMAHTAAGTLTASTNGQTSSTTFAATSTYETRVLNFGGSDIWKKLNGVKVTAVPLLSGQSITLKYRKNEDIKATGSWTTIFTWSYNASDYTKNVSHSAVTIESTGATLPEFADIQFQITATGGASVLGLDANAEEITRDTYDA